MTFVISVISVFRNRRVFVSCLMLSRVSPPHLRLRSSSSTTTSSHQQPADNSDPIMTNKATQNPKSSIYNNQLNTRYHILPDSPSTQKVINRAISRTENRHKTRPKHPIHSKASKIQTARQFDSRLLFCISIRCRAWSFVCNAARRSRK